MKRLVLILTVALTLAASTPVAAHTAPPPGTGGWVPHTLRPDGLPVTHYCGQITFSIDSNNLGVAEEIRSAVYRTYQVTGQDYREVAPGQGRIRFRWYWPPGSPDALAYTTPGAHDGWNWTLRTIYLNPARVTISNLRYAILHEFGHALGMGHTPVGVWSIMGVQLSDWTMTDGAALLYLTGHPPVPGEPCWRSDW